MATIKLKKGYNLNLEGSIATSTVASAPAPKLCGIVPDDFWGVTPRMEKQVGDHVAVGEALYHDKKHEEVKVVSPVSGVVKAVNRGDRRKIESIEIACDGSDSRHKPRLDAGVKAALLESGLWVMLRQRPYDIVPDPDVTPRDIFVTCFDSAPLAPDLLLVTGDKQHYIKKGVEALASLTSGKVYLGCAPGHVIEVEGAETNVFDGPHPAGNAGVQINNVKPVNKGEVVWTLDVVTLARIGELLATGMASFDTIVAVDGSEVARPQYVKTVMGSPVADLVEGNIAGDSKLNKRYISGNVLTGSKVDPETGYLRAPYRQITVIPENDHPDEFMGWASLSPKKFSIYRDFTGWLLGRRGKKVKMDARLQGGERAIVMSGEYDRMLPMDIYPEFLIKSIIAFDIDKMEQLGIYEVAPEDFALAEYADTSKLELQRIVRQGLDKMKKEME